MLILRILPPHLEWAVGILIAEHIDTWEEIILQGQVEIRAALPKGRRAPALLEALNRRERAFGAKLFLKKKIFLPTDTSWQKKFLDGLKPFTLPNFDDPTDKSFPVVTIDPSGESKPNPQTLSLVAGMAFGTGTHLSTQLAAWCLQESLYQNKQASVLDIGTGSGILAMVAKLHHTKKILAVDNDPDALFVAKRNFKKNNMDNIGAKSSIDQVSGKFHVVIANILAPVLIQLKPKILNRTKKNGQIILSGLTYGDIPALLKCYGKCRLITRYNRKGWSALRLQKTKA